MPYASKAQQRYFNAVLKKKHPEMVAEFNKETKGKYDKLPDKKEPPHAKEAVDFGAILDMFAN
ncbi:MAG: hypothetical protein KKF39_07025 [Nanoarchaeota archaeon]|nr:hypothetical protein [Nanoarchaeota archaeon]